MGFYSFFLLLFFLWVSFRGLRHCAMEQTEAVYHLMVACDTVGSGGLNTIEIADVFEGFSMNM